MVDIDHVNVIVRDPPVPLITGSINTRDDADDVKLLDDVNDDGDLDEDNRCVCGEISKFGKRSDDLQLSAREAERLLGCLDDATGILHQHLDKIYNERILLAQRLNQNKSCPGFRRYLGNILSKFTGAKVMATTVFLQLICLVMLTLVDNLPREEHSKKTALEAGSIGMIILQTANLVAVVIVSGQIVAQVHAKRVSSTLLIQAYLATILLFAGIYTSTYRLAVDSWKFVDDPVEIRNPDMIVITYTRFLFYSVSTATLCGGADALPKEWYTCLFASCQMLLSFMYFTSVLGTAIAKRAKYNVKSHIQELNIIKQRAQFRNGNL